MPAARAATPTRSVAFGIDAGDLGLKPDAPDEQTMLLQRAIDRAARERTTLMLPPGTYRCGELRLPSNAKLQGTRGTTRIELTRNTSLFTSNRADNIDLRRPRHRWRQTAPAGRAAHSCISYRAAAFASPIARSTMPAATASRWKRSAAWSAVLHDSGCRRWRAVRDRLDRPHHCEQRHSPLRQ